VSDAPAASGFLLDLNRCTGCHACELACSTENDLGWGRSWRQVDTFNGARRPGAPTYHLSLACNHCEKAPCLDQCPALAIRRDGTNGTVQIDAERCMGCRYCRWVCPYDAPKFDGSAGVVAKCTLCSHRLAEHRPPACVEGCPTRALRFGALEGAEAVPGFPEAPVRPAIRFTPPWQGMRPPEATWTPPQEALAALAEARSSPSVPLRDEWPLLVFTLTMALLVGWLLAAMGGAVAPSAWFFLALAALAMGGGMLHLGRPLRAWRAVLNLRRSWLSREIASTGAFVTASFLWLLGAGVAASWIGLLSCALGVVSLFCMDRVYDPVRAGSRFHSADTILTAPLVAALILGWSPVAVALGLCKLGLYVNRWTRSLPDSCGWNRLPLRIVLMFVRVGFGLAVPLWVLLPQPGLALVFFAIGELVDRAEFYEGLRPVTPRLTLARALAGVLEKR